MVQRQSKNKKEDENEDNLTKMEKNEDDIQKNNEDHLKKMKTSKIKNTIQWM
jgi:hypothetical protein